MSEPKTRVRGQLVNVHDVIVGERLRALSHEHVTHLRNSFTKLGGHLQLQPIVLDPHMRLVDGAHRLEAAKQAGWSHLFAIVLHELTPANRAMLEAEANLVRKNLSPVEIEEVWRNHYEPGLRVQARARQLSGLRQGSKLRPQRATPPPRLSVAVAAKQVTGLSLQQLRAIGEIRALSNSLAAAPKLRAAAGEALQDLAAPGASIAAARRRVAAARREIARGAESGQASQPTSTGKVALERALVEAADLAQSLSQQTGSDFEEMARHSPANRDSLRGLRTSLTHALANVVAIECRLESSPLAAMARIGTEVGALHSRLLRAQLAQTRDAR
ncbi:MAG: ParB N-terminal domain-containing protein [Leucobacter sp.]|nr:ParB N-terminal domain-containing protein [Leucobacter sp.]